MPRPGKSAESNLLPGETRPFRRFVALRQRLRVLPERLRPARGILLGVIISLAMWAVIAFAVLRWTR